MRVKGKLSRLHYMPLEAQHHTRPDPGLYQEEDDFADVEDSEED